MSRTWGLTVTSGDVESAFPRPALVRPAAMVPLDKALISGTVDGFSGALRVSGHPGGVIHLERGLITAVDSPGAPDVSTLLLSSGRLSETDWATVVKAGATDGRIGAELVERKLVGCTELQVMCQAAAQDGAFAIAVGRIGDCVYEPGSARHWLPARAGLDRQRLLMETERKLTAFARGSISIAPYQDRLSLGPRIGGRPDATEVITGNSRAATDEEQHEILVRVNGRRSARDIAFMLGRSVYAITVQVSRMAADGYVQVNAAPERLDRGGASGSDDSAELSLRPRTRRTTPSAVGSHGTSGTGLPHRRHRVEGSNEMLAL